MIDAKTGMVICTLPVGGKPEFAQADGKGKIYFNVENTSEIMELDEAKAAITKRIKLAPVTDRAVWRSTAKNAGSSPSAAIR